MVNALTNLQIDFTFSIRKKAMRNILLLQANDKYKVV